MPIPLSDAIEYIRANGYNNKTEANIMAKNLEKGGKLTLDGIKAYLGSREEIAKFAKKCLVKKKTVEEHPMNSEPERSTCEEHPMDKEEHLILDKEHPMDKEEHLPLNIEVNQGAPEPFNVNRNTKLTKSFDNKLKQHAKKLKISVSALIRNVLMEGFDEREEKEYE